jgi:CubicO group peptidase (beta-lactamase class C family)
MTMIGFPPHPADRWSLATWQNAPANRWSFQHVREVVPTARVSRGTGAAAPLPQAAGLDDEQTVWRLEGRWSTVAEVIEDTYTDGFLVLHRGQVVTERYPSGMPADRPHILMSVSKSVVGCLVGILADEGAVDVHSVVETYVPELAASGYAGATVQDVLDMRSGVTFSETYLDPTAEVRLLEQVIGWAPRTIPDLPTSMYDYLATLTAGRTHGAEFEYRSCETDILAWICERATGTRLPELLSAKIWSKLGCEQDMDAAVDPAGAVFADGGLSATLRDLGRFGQMLLDGGVAQGRPVDRGQPGRRHRHPGRLRPVRQRQLAARRRVPQPVLAARRPRGAAVPGHPRPDGLGGAGPRARRGQAVVLAAPAGAGLPAGHDGRRRHDRLPAQPGRRVGLIPGARSPAAQPEVR